MRCHKNTAQRGFSMVELMVALVLGVVLTTGVISVFVTSKNSYNLSNAMGQVQEGGRYALTTLQPIIALAGYTGCSHIDADSLSSYRSMLGTGDSDPVYMVQYGVMGYEYTGTGTGASHTDTTGQTPAVATAASEWSPTLSAELFTAISNAGYPVVKYSDILIVHEEQANPALIISDSGVGTNGPLTYDTAHSPPAMAAGTVAIASNCAKQVTAFQITAWSSGSITHATPGGANPGNVTSNANFNPNPPASSWPLAFATGADTVGPELTYVFYIGKSAVDQGTSLYEVQLQTTGANAGKLGTPLEIVPGVENMQLIYGIDTDADVDHIPNKYETADLITADTSNTAGLGNYTPPTPPPPGAPPDGIWNEVVSVRVAFIMHSDANSTENNTQVTKASGGTQTLTNVLSQKFYMLGTSATDSFTYNSFADRRLRRYFAETFSVRSQLP